MSNVNENKEIKIKLIKHFIKDLSFENPQTVNKHNADFNNNNKIDVNMNAIYEGYENNNFSLTLEYTLDCLSKNSNEKLCYLELKYFGFFKILTDVDADHKSHTECGIKILFPFAKEVIEDVMKRGGSIPITLNAIDFSLTKN